jgi:hypothetical protein
MSSQHGQQVKRADVYGQKKRFASDHAEDILAMRKRMSADKVADVYGGIITRHDVANLERLHKIDD